MSVESVEITKTVFQNMDVGDVNELHSLSSDTNANTARTLLNVYQPPTLLKSSTLNIENNNIISNSTNCNVYLYGQCSNVPESRIPFHLQPKQTICDPTGKNGVFSPYISFSYSYAWPLSHIQQLPNLPKLKVPTLPFLKLRIPTFEKQANEKQAKRLETKKKSQKTVNKPFKCDKCKKGFRNKSGLSNHKIIHNGVKPHKCRFGSCTKAFGRSCDLTRHIRLHTGYKPFRCTFKSCNKAFTRSVQLRLHKMDHSGIRPHHCSICKKGFKTLQNVQIHMRIHTGEKPYKCKLCQKRFTQSSSLRTHLATIHS